MNGSCPFCFLSCFVTENGRWVKVVILLFSVGWPPVSEKAVHLVYRACLSWTFVNLRVCFFLLV